MPWRLAGRSVALLAALAGCAVTGDSPDLRQTAPATGASSPEFDPTGRFALNLQSLRAPVDSGAIRQHELFRHFRLYRVHHREDGSKDFDRIRLGFFPTRQAAEALAARLELAFPGVWVVEVSPSEQAHSREHAIVFPESAGNGAPAVGRRD